MSLRRAAAGGEGKRERRAVHTRFHTLSAADEATAARA